MIVVFDMAISYMTMPTKQVGHCLHASVVDAEVLRRLHVLPQHLW